MKNNLKNVEQKLNEFFINDKKIDVIKNSIKTLNNKREYLKNQIKELKLNFDISIKSSSISGMPVANINTTSYFEKDIIRQIERSENLIKDINIEILQLENDLLMLQIKNEKIYGIMKILNTNIKQLLNYKYRENLSEIEISHKLNISITHYHRKKKKALDTIYNMLMFYENISI